MEREKNFIAIGITETESKDPNERQAHDKRKVKKQLRCVAGKEMQSLKIKGFSKYKPGANHPLKV